MNLLDINKACAELFEELQDTEGEIPEGWEARAIALDAMRDDKLEACACVLKNLAAWVDLHDAEIDRLTARKKALEGRYERLKEWVGFNLNGETWEKGLHKFSYRKSVSVEVNIEAEKLPLEFSRMKFEANKTEIKKALEAGATVEGCRLVTKNSLQVK